MRPFALIIGVLLSLGVPSAVAATEWTILTDTALHDRLEGRRVSYEDGAWQEFRASGRTLYNVSGRDSWGYWRIQGSQYCSTWPPSDLWACYEIQLTDRMVRFIDGQGNITDGFFAN